MFISYFSKFEYLVVPVPLFKLPASSSLISYISIAAESENIFRSLTWEPTSF
jgi:hypothetical protein